MEDLGVTYALDLLLIGKPVVDFLFVTIAARVVIKVIIQTSNYHAVC